MAPQQYECMYLLAKDEYESLQRRVSQADPQQSQQKNKHYVNVVQGGEVPHPGAAGTIQNFELVNDGGNIYVGRHQDRCDGKPASTPRAKQGSDGLKEAKSRQQRQQQQQQQYHQQYPPHSGTSAPANLTYWPRPSYRPTVLGVGSEPAPMSIDPPQSSMRSGRSGPPSSSFPASLMDVDGDVFAGPPAASSSRRRSSTADVSTSTPRSINSANSSMSNLNSSTRGSQKGKGKGKKGRGSVSISESSALPPPPTPPARRRAVRIDAETGRKMLTASRGDNAAARNFIRRRLAQLEGRMTGSASKRPISAGEDFEFSPLQKREREEETEVGGASSLHQLRKNMLAKMGV